MSYPLKWTGGRGYLPPVKSDTLVYWALVSTVGPGDGADVLVAAVILAEGALLPFLTLHCKVGLVYHGLQ